MSGIIRLLWALLEKGAAACAAGRRAATMTTM